MRFGGVTEQADLARRLLEATVKLRAFVVEFGAELAETAERRIGCLKRLGGRGARLYGSFSPTRGGASLPPASKTVADMVRLQRLTGARPGEVWQFRPIVHKTEHHGREPTNFLGPKAQEALLPYLYGSPS